MQKLKSDVQKTILEAAEYLFIRNGYKKSIYYPYLCRIISF